MVERPVVWHAKKKHFWLENYNWVTILVGKIYNWATISLEKYNWATTFAGNYNWVTFCILTFCHDQARPSAVSFTI